MTSNSRLVEPYKTTLYDTNVHSNSTTMPISIKPDDGIIWNRYLHIQDICTEPGFNQTDNIMFVEQRVASSSILGSKQLKYITEKDLLADGLDEMGEATEFEFGLEGDPPPALLKNDHCEN